MLAFVLKIFGNRAADSSGPEQENGLLEQRGGNLSHHQCSARFFQERHHRKRGINDLGTHRRWGRRRRPTKSRTLKARPRNERPEHHQCGVSCRLVWGNHRAMREKPCKVEIAMCNTLNPTADTLA